MTLDSAILARLARATFRLDDARKDVAKAKAESKVPGKWAKWVLEETEAQDNFVLALAEAQKAFLDEVEAEAKAAGGSRYGAMEALLQRWLRPRSVSDDVTR